jgi:hypothetical protein
MFMKWTAAASVLLLSLQLFGTEKNEKVYERGVLMDIQSKENCRTSFQQGTSKTICSDYVYYWVRVGDMVYKGWCHDRLITPCSIDYTIHDPVEVRFDGSKMLIKRSDGKEVHTTVEREDRLVKSSAEKESTGKITITSVPGEADIFVDGANVGNSPATVKLAPGKHKVEIKAPGFKEWVKEVTVLEGAELSLSGTLEKD